MCVSCRQMKQKNELLRVVKTTDGFQIDESGKIDGRGAYICKSCDCVKKAIKTKAFNKSFKSAVPTEIYECLEDCFVE